MRTQITFKGAPLTLVGRALKVGMVAPGFRAVTPELKESGLADFEGRVKVITSFPSLDTPVCDLQLKEFNKRAAALSADTVVIGISKDLPFAQKRFCDLNGIERVTVLSDYKFGSFGLNYGLLIRELQLLARSVLVVDKKNILRYMQIVSEISMPPDYEAALSILGKVLAQSPAPAGDAAVEARCVPCEGVVPALPNEKVASLLAKLRGWESVDGKKITKEFKFKDFSEAKYFLDAVAAVAEEQGHHPGLFLGYGKVKVTLSTHAAGGLTGNDFIMAGLIDDIGG